METSNNDVLLQEILAQLSATRKTVEQLTEQIKKKDAEIARLNQILLNMQRARFGQRSEKTVYVLDNGCKQLCMFDETGDGISEVQTEQPVAETKRISVTSHTRKAKRTLEELCAGLPAEEIVCDIPESERVNENGEPLKCIGTEYVRTELIKEGPKYSVRKYVRKVYADSKAEARTGEADIRKAAVPAPLLAHSYASASTVTDIIIKKYADGLPLYRQEQIWKREGVDLKRGTMCNWVIQASDIYLKRIWSSLKAELLSQAVIHADETVLQVLKEPGRDATAKSRLWVYASGKRTARQIRLFRYEDSRKGACAEEMLSGYKGLLVCDGYSGYNVLGGTARAGCWAHMRRKWYEAMPKEATLANSVAAVGMDFCTKLFEAERGFDDLSDSERLVQRRKISLPIVEEYYNWLGSLFHPTGKLKDAATYAINQKPYLCAFLDHGEIEISNNQVENAIRPAVIGRKNWLFCDTPEGAEASAVVYSVIETAKACGLNPEKYIMHLLTVLPGRFATNSEADVSDLLPWSSLVLDGCVYT